MHPTVQSQQTHWARVSREEQVWQACESMGPLLDELHAGRIEEVVPGGRDDVQDWPRQVPVEGHLAP